MLKVHETSLSQVQTFNLWFVRYRYKPFPPWIEEDWESHCSPIHYKTFYGNILHWSQNQSTVCQQPHYHALCPCHQHLFQYFKFSWASFFIDWVECLRRVIQNVEQLLRSLGLVVHFIVLGYPPARLWWKDVSNINSSSRMSSCYLLPSRQQQIDKHTQLKLLFIGSLGRGGGLIFFFLVYT